MTKSKSSALAFLCDLRQTVRMPTDTPRETMRETRREARARITGELMEAARRQLAEVGAAGLSLREVAREIGMVSSAVYRYVESRDDLLTRLIIEAYDSLGTTAEAAAAQTAESDLERWAATAHAVRRWAIEHPHDYQLVYGSPVPGYAAPDDTIAPGTRVTFALVGVLVDAHRAGRLADAAGPTPPLTPQLDADLRALTGEIAADVEPAVVLAFLVAWTQLFGLITFELTNQTRNVVTDHEALFDASVRRLGHQIGLR
jgi:AcrR family transcriptional regulator